MTGSARVDSRRRRAAGRTVLLALLLVAVLAGPAQGQETAEAPTAAAPTLNEQVSDFLGPKGLSTTLEIVLVLTVLSLAPSIVIMMTSFTRIVVVLALLRQAMATQQLPPTQVITGLALFMTVMIMAPVAVQVHEQAIQPYTEGELEGAEMLTRAADPVRRFMIKQIEHTGNTKDVLLFTDYLDIERSSLNSLHDVPTHALIPAFMISELKTAFLMGFKLYLPFLIIDMVVASVLISMGMLMLPPVLISLPFKLMLFVLVDGWHLVAGTLLYSFVR